MRLQISAVVQSGQNIGDGKLDALVVSELAEVASAFYIDPLSTPAMLMQLVPRVDHVIGIGTQTDLVEGDFNEDGRLDVLISTTGQKSQLTILKGVGD